MRRTFLAASLAAASLSAAPAAAQPMPPPIVTPDPPPIDRRVSDLERRVAALEGKTTVPVLASAPCGCPLSTCVCGDKCQCPTAAPTTYPQYLVGGRWVGEAEFRRAFPAASGVAAPIPFGQAAGCAGGRCTIPTTPATGAAGPTAPLTFSLDRFPAGGTNTGAPAATSGGTSGCANGNCAAPTTYRRGLFRR